MANDKQWHLAANEKLIAVTEVELQLWRVFYGFLRWQEECERNANNTDLNGDELALLHVIRMRDKPKTLSDIGKILNRNDVYNINYSLRKLLKKELIRKLKPVPGTKSVFYEVTKKGLEDTERYTQMRTKVLTDLFSGVESINLEEMAKNMTKMKAIYDEADSIVAYTKLDLPDNSKAKSTDKKT